MKRGVRHFVVLLVRLCLIRIGVMIGYGVAKVVRWGRGRRGRIRTYYG